MSRRELKKKSISKKDEKTIERLVEEGKERIEELKEIDQQISQIKKSTKTVVSFISPAHDFCCTKYEWYYNWHIKPYATKVHTGILFVVLLLGITLSMPFYFIFPEKTMAADYTCTLNATGNWNDTTKWDNCNGEYPGQTDATVYDVVIPTGRTVTLNANNLNINNADNTSLGNISVTGTLTTSNNNITFGALTINTGGVVTAGSSTFNVYGNWSISAGTFTYNTSTVNMVGTTQSMSTGSVYNLQITTPGQTVTFSGLIYCRGVFTVGSTTGERVVVTSSNKGIYYYNAITPIVFQGDYKASSGSSTGGYNINGITSFFYPQNADGNMPAGTYGGIYCYTTTNDHTITMQGVVDSVTGPFSIYSATAGKKSILNMDGNALSVYALYIGSSTSTLMGQLTTGNATLTSATHITLYAPSIAEGNKLTAGSSTINVGTNYINGGSYLDAGTSTFDFKGTSGTQTLTTGGTGTGFAFNNLTHSGAGTLRLVTNDIDINGTFTNSDGTFDADTNDKNMTFAGAWNNTGDAVFSRGSGTMTFDGTSTVTNTSSNVPNLGAIAIPNSVTLGSAITVTSTSGAGTLNLGAGSYTLTITGTGTPLAIGTFDKGTGSTTLYTGTSATNITAVAYNNLTLTPASGSVTYSMAEDLDTASSTAMSGDLTINSGATLQTMPVATSYNLDCVNLTINASGIITANGSTFTLSGNWSNSGTFTAGSSTVTFSGTAQSIAGATTFYHITVASSTQLDITSVTINAFDVTVNFSKKLRLDNASDSIIASSNFVNNGTIEQSAGTLQNTNSTSYWGVDNNSTGTYTMSGGTMTIAKTFNNYAGTLAVSGTANISISEYLFNRAGYNSTITMTAGTLYAASIPNYQGTITHSGGTMTSGGYYRENSTAGGNYYGSGTALLKIASSYIRTMKAGTYFNDVQIYGNGSISADSAQPVYINGNLTIDATKTFTANNINIYVKGNWTNSGAFVAGTGTVTFNGTTASAITGTTTFNNLTMDATTDGAKTITFPTGVGNKQIISGTWTLDGDSGKVLTLVSATPTTAWYFEIAAPFTSGDYIDVKDSWSSDTNKITPGANVTNSGNNDGWIFNQAPVNDSLTFTNPYTSNIAVSDDTTEWTFRALVTDADGSTDLDYVELGFANSSDSTQPYDSLKYRWTEATDTFSETYDTQDAGTITSVGTESSASGNQWTLDFKIKIDNDFLAKDTNYAAELYSIDASASSDTDNYADIYQVKELTISLSVDDGTLAFGSLLPGSIITGTTVTTVSTNFANGYSLKVHDGVSGAYSALLHTTDTTTRIADYAGTIDTPTLWSGTGIGICVFAASNKDTSKWGAGTTVDDELNKYAGVPETATTINTKAGSPTSNDTASIGYKIVVPNTQQTGDYAGTVTYTATGNLL